MTDYSSHLSLLKKLFMCDMDKVLSVFDIEQSFALANDLLVINFACDYGDEIPNHIPDEFVNEFMELYRISMLSLFNKQSNETTEFNLEMRATIKTVHNVLLQSQDTPSILEMDVTSNISILAHLQKLIMSLWGDVEPIADPISKQQAKIELAQAAPSYKHRYTKDLSDIKGELNHQLQDVLDLAISSSVSK